MYIVNPTRLVHSTNVLCSSSLKLSIQSIRFVSAGFSLACDPSKPDISPPAGSWTPNSLISKCVRIVTIIHFTFFGMCHKVVSCYLPIAVQTSFKLVSLGRLVYDSQPHMFFELSLMISSDTVSYQTKLPLLFGVGQIKNFKNRKYIKTSQTIFRITNYTLISFKIERVRFGTFPISPISIDSSKN